MSKNSVNLETQLLNRTRKLTQILIVSGALNVALLGTSVYSVFKNRSSAVPIELKPLAKETKTPLINNEQLLRAYSLLPFQELVLRLENSELVESGYTKRDLALACLVAFHHFNIERALGGLELQKRQIPFSNTAGGEQIPLIIFPGLADFQYQAILQYARTEKWPLTAQGLFFELQRSPVPKDATLLEAFYLTPHFHTAHLLFTRSGLKIEKEPLVEMLAQGDWQTLNRFTEEQKLAQDLSVEKRRNFLLSYLELRSPIAAQIFLEIDLEFALKRMSDTQILTLFELQPLHPQLATFAKELITSPRSDNVWKQAAAQLYASAGESIPEPYDHANTVKRFASQPARAAQHVAAAPANASAPSHVAPAAKRRTHTVAQGETLWKIARKYRVTPEAIKRANKLDTDRLRVGKKLEIPEK
jgi:LysM repeat protein